MGNLKIAKTDIPGVFLIKPTVFKDNRGSLFEFYNEKDLADDGFATEFVHDNQPLSIKGVLRTLICKG